FRRWGEGGPSLEILSGKGGNTIWGFTEYSQEYLFGRMNYNGPVMPACPVSDISGDGVAELALVKNLTWQPGAQIDIYNVARDEVVKTVVLEEIDFQSGRDLEWHPSLMAEEVGDINGDGSKELAVIAIVGRTENEKEIKLMLVDINNEKVIGDFAIVGKEFVDIGHGGEIGVVGLNGEFYFLNVDNDLRITSPAEASSQSSPVTITWDGIEAVAFNQVFIDNAEVGRTNGNTFTLPIAGGDHVVTIRSLDEYGRAVYQTADFTVSKSSLVVMWAIIPFVILLALALWPTLSGLVMRRRRRSLHG
ncbi:hypothetical protein ACFLWV_00260, partial [Chloroflexota bacterium]